MNKVTLSLILQNGDIETKVTLSRKTKSNYNLNYASILTLKAYNVNLLLFTSCAAGSSI